MCRCEKLGCVFSDSSHKGAGCYFFVLQSHCMSEFPSPIRTNKVWADLLPVTLLVPGRLWLVPRLLLSTTLRFLAVLLPGWAIPGWHWSQGLFNPSIPLVLSEFHKVSVTTFLQPAAISLVLVTVLISTSSLVHTLCVHPFCQVTDRGVNQVRSQPPALLQLLLACSEEGPINCSPLGLTIQPVFICSPRQQHLNLDTRVVWERVLKTFWRLRWITCSALPSFTNPAILSQQEIISVKHDQCWSGRIWP